MKDLKLKKIARTGALVAGLALMMVMTSTAQNSNTVNSGTTTTTSTSTPVRTSNNSTTVQQKTEVRTETERGLPWGLLGLLGLAGLIPRKREVNQVAVAEFRDTSPKEIHTEVRETTTNTVTDNTSTTENRNNS